MTTLLSESLWPGRAVRLWERIRVTATLWKQWQCNMRGNRHGDTYLDVFEVLMIEAGT